MQTILHVSCSGVGSLRDQIATDQSHLAAFGLRLTSYKRGRAHGWAKLHSTLEDRAGAINIRWDGTAGLLICRVVTRGGDPAQVTGDLTAYLVSRHRKRIQALTIVPEV
jgi:hypothetical protein